jgi:hypothetical protein
MTNQPRQATSPRVGGAERDLSSIRERFGKADLLASILGTFTALGVFVFLGALFAAGAANIELQTNLLNPEGGLDEVEIVGAVTAVAVVFVSFLVGGIAAGRMARYDGGLNGIGTALWMLFLVALFAALGAFVGAEYNAFASADLPNWIAQIDAEEVTAAAIGTTVVAVVAMFGGGYLGGRIGETYHRKVDAAIVDEALR